MLSPIVPHITHELWHALGHATAIVNTAWPLVDPTALVRDEIEIVVQVNGKLRAQIQIGTTAEEEAVKAVALAHPKIQQHTDGKEIKKIIFVPQKLVNIVVAG